MDGFGEIEERRVGEGVLELVEARGRIALGQSGQNDEELFSAVATNEIRGADVLCHAKSCIAQDEISGEVAESVVDLFEVVDIGQDDGELRPFVASVIELALKDIEDCGTIPKAGQGIVGGLVVEGFASCEELDLFGFEFAGALRDELFPVAAGA